jgi:hypothetical protein
VRRKAYVAIGTLIAILFALFATLISIEKSREYKGNIPEWELEAKTKSGNEHMGQWQKEHLPPPVDH